MEREEVLRKSRKEQNDEGLDYVENTGRRKGIMVLLLMSLFVILYNRIVHIQTSFGVCVVVSTYLAVEEYYKYKYTKQKKTLIYIGILLILAVCSLHHIVVWGN